jgi:DNA-binding NarL/FixJ family response regulator
MNGAASAWSQWSASAQSAAQEHRSSQVDRHSLARAAAEARRELLAATQAAEQAVARAHALSQQLERALEILIRSESQGAAPRVPDHGDPWTSLSPREREVLALVAEGRSNKAIAEELFVSPNTVKTHVAALLAKLQVETRVQLAALAARNANWPEAA